MADIDVLKQRAIPLGMIVAAMCIFAGVIGAYGGVEALAASWAALGLSTALGVVLMIVACFITARIMGIGFGSLDTAALKLAAIYLLPDAVSATLIAVADLPILARIVSVVMYLGLLKWLFDLDWLETIVCAVVIGIVSMLAAAAATSVLRAG